MGQDVTVFAEDEHREAGAVEAARGGASVAVWSADEAASEVDDGVDMTGCVEETVVVGVDSRVGDSDRVVGVAVFTLGGLGREGQHECDEA